jgi:polysaccharide transporter, PST family
VALRQKAAKSVFWSALESGSTSLIAFVSLVILAKLLQPSDFGVFSVSLAVVEIAAIFTNMIFHDALIQRHVATEAHFNSAFTVSIGVSLLVYAMLWAAFPYLATLIADDRVVEVGRVLGLALLVTGPVNVLAARHSREFGFRLLAVRTLAGRLSGGMLGILGAFLGFGLWSLVVQHVAVMVLSAATLVLRNPYQRLRLTTDLRPCGELLGYGAAALTSLAASFMTKRIFVFCFGVFLGTEIAGFLNLAFRLVDTVWSISGTAVSQVLLPTLSRLQDDRSRLLKAYQASLKATTAILYPGFAGVGVLAPEIIQFLFGSKWAPASPYVLILSVLTFSQVARLSAALLLSTMGYVRDICLINLSMLVYLLAAIALTRLSSDYVALTVWSSAEILLFMAITLVLQLRLKIQISRQLSYFFAPLVGAAVMMIVVQAVRGLLPAELAIHWKLLSLAAIGGSTYVGLMLIFGRQFVEPVVGIARVILAKE